MGRIKQFTSTATAMNSLKNLKSYKPGQSGNPKGRIMGSRQRLTEKFIDSSSRSLYLGRFLNQTENS